jgi:hypothetical protein
MHAWWDQAGPSSRKQLLEFLVTRIYQEEGNKTSGSADNIDIDGDKTDDRGHKLKITIGSGGCGNG